MRDVRTKVRARISGILRGIIKEGLYVEKATKNRRYRPSGIEEYVYTISDKAQAVGGWSFRRNNVSKEREGEFKMGDLSVMRKALEDINNGKKN